MNNKRRTFLYQVGAAAVGSAVLPACARFAPHTVEHGKALVARAALAGEQSFMIKPAGFTAPIYISERSPGVYSAVLMLCTHKRCTLRPAGPVLACPCHGSEFTPEGRVLQEPAERDLQSFAVHSDQNYIYVQLVNETEQ